jgi:hypothetical protein
VSHAAARPGRSAPALRPGGGRVDVARAGPGARSLLLRPGASVRGGPASRHRDRRRRGCARARACGRRRALRRNRADEREDDHDRDAGRARRQPDASRLDRRGARCERGGGLGRRDGRAERHRGVRRPVRAPRHPHRVRGPGLPRPARLPARARGAWSRSARRRTACARGRRGPATCAAGRARATACRRNAFARCGACCTRRPCEHERASRRTGGSPSAGARTCSGDAGTGRASLVAHRRRRPWPAARVPASLRAAGSRTGARRRDWGTAASQDVEGAAVLAARADCRARARARESGARPPVAARAARSAGARRLWPPPARGAGRGRARGARVRRRGGHRSRSYDQWPVSDPCGSEH